MVSLPDLLTHYAVSYLIASRSFKPRRALLVALMGLLPDIDALFRIHRWVTHSLVLAALAVAIAVLSVSATRREYLGHAALFSALYALHIVMDVFTGPTPILWPLSNKEYAVSIGVNGVISCGGVGMDPYAELVISDADFTQKPMINGPVVSATGVMASIAVAALILAERFRVSSKNSVEW